MRPGDAPGERPAAPVTYLMNAAVLTDYGEWCFEGPLDDTRVRALLETGFISAIGHEATAQYLSRRFGLDVQCARVTVTMNPGDRAVILRLLRRLGEGESLDATALDAEPVEFGLLERRR